MDPYKFDEDFVPDILKNQTLCFTIDRNRVWTEEEHKAQVEKVFGKIPEVEQEEEEEETEEENKSNAL
jgi:hypothetical protein